MTYVVTELSQFKPPLKDFYVFDLACMMILPLYVFDLAFIETVRNSVLISNQ